jgi:hypothetical protein
MRKQEMLHANAKTGVIDSRFVPPFVDRGVSFKNIDDAIKDRRKELEKQYDGCKVKTFLNQILPYPLFKRQYFLDELKVFCDIFFSSLKRTTMLVNESRQNKSSSLVKELFFTYGKSFVEDPRKNKLFLEILDQHFLSILELHINRELRHRKIAS